MLRRLLQALQPGGVAYVQVPTYVHGYEFSLGNYLEHIRMVQGIEMHPLPQPWLFELLRQQDCELLEILDDDRWTSLGMHHVSNVFLARKRS